ncbi:hypothetical protein DDB_G0290101 [Dictyostelium discoideum AX4]|uniref:Uncharacterized protein n=1 Tax=Dictyostelium discoideum TaxID=44689 RepID=Q54GK0_DICDI|nr:hypothetical protein DDB_G0290101 [Dictyostelium discoideum AX4]EAL62389.1 hypothetical protein DDB_G0290101 [Dictyostelium discoideum AX4]|eukprot:XP_635895.1 hypothetical protein DDB_G0290101 [Dictyostelium discoideum AX4]
MKNSFKNNESSINPIDSQSLAFKDNCNYLSKLNTVSNKALLLNGFNQKLTKGIIPEGVKELYICDIKQELIIGSIPNTQVEATVWNATLSLMKNRISLVHQNATFAGDRRCRLCSTAEESIEHLVSDCASLYKSGVIPRHDGIVKEIVKTLINRYQIPKVTNLLEPEIKYTETNSNGVTVTKVKINVDMNFKNSTSINNKPDIVVFDYVAKLIRVIDMKMINHSMYKLLSIITGAFGSIISTSTTHTINNITHPIKTLKECVNQLPVTTVSLWDGFNQKLTKGIKPKGVKDLYIGSIEQDLIIDSIPNTVTTVSLRHGFNQKLTKGIIPEGVKLLRLRNIKQKLIIDSILNTVTTVNLCDGFNQKLTKGIIPEGVKELRLSDIKQDLIISSIPITVSTVCLCNGFNQELTKCIIPERFKELHIGDIKQELIIGSIPNTVTTVRLLDGFNQKLTKGIIPESVKELYICDIKQDLMIGSMSIFIKVVKNYLILSSL